MENMNKNNTFIIFDNQKIYPIDRFPDLDSKSMDIKEDNPFDIIDRVTISNKAREKTKLLKAKSGDM